jgi:hypothetical protein
LNEKDNSKGGKTMRRNEVIGFMLIAFVAATTGCELLGSQSTGGGGTDGEILWTYITSENPYKNWELAPGKGEYYPAEEPHGALLTTYVNDKALEAIEQRKSIMPDGAIIVKDNYRADKTLESISVMKKVEGYNPQANDWFWAEYKPNGEIEEEGKVFNCIGCHSKERDNDYSFYVAEVQ